MQRYHLYLSLEPAHAQAGLINLVSVSETRLINQTSGFSPLQCFRALWEISAVPQQDTKGASWGAAVASLDVFHPKGRQAH